jgi:chemotaxis protein methyltransferase CheR
VPQLISARGAGEKRLRIWSAGCSTGEEAYSIAIAPLSQHRRFIAWNISILATDINPHALQKAARGSTPNGPPRCGAGLQRGVFPAGLADTI